jgi:sulfonate transport system substrate-binding protein
VSEEFAAAHPDIVKRVIKVYEQGRKWALENPDALAELLAKTAKIPIEVARKQLGERTDLTHNKIGDAQRDSIVAAGKALQSAGVIEADVDIQSAVDKLIDRSFTEGLAN